MENKPSLLLYIHGFNSSPLSHKAQVMQQFCQDNRPDITVVVPQMPCFPQQAAHYLVDIISQYEKTHHLGLVGSSLGGYLSTWLHERYGYKVVLINPAVKPYELLVDFLGEQENPYTHEKYTLESKHIDELKALDVKTIRSPQDFWLLQQEGDEVLDFRQAVTKYAHSKQTVEPGGDHSFIDFERYPERIIQFLAL